ISVPWRDPKLPVNERGVGYTNGGRGSSFPARDCAPFAKPHPQPLLNAIDSPMKPTQENARVPSQRIYLEKAVREL
ncbi:MAG: hypothetical protein DMG32_27530, partial [Acidobacteria bacterium]